MKHKSILLLVSMALPYGSINAIDIIPKFIVTSEKEMYILYDQMLDSARLYNRYLYEDPLSLDIFSFGCYKDIDSKDTIMKVDQLFSGMSNRSYFYYISNQMPVDFYERFLDYLKKIEKRETYFLKHYSTRPLYHIRDILIKQYESGKLNKKDSLKALELMEQTTLRMINDEHAYSIVKKYDKYMTDKICQALINVIENPFYPAEYLDFYMSRQDTSILDTIGMPEYVRDNYMKYNRRQFTDEETVYYRKLQNFLTYEKIGQVEYNGLSAGQAYLQRKKDKFREKGYLSINFIAEYAYQKQDELLIKHLKAFKKKHPDYPLKYF
jgi:hypothetical protein